MKKYILTDVKINILGRTLFQIKATRNFGNVEEGELGGYIEKEENLKHDGDAWVYGDACVCGDACVYGDACVCGDARVYGDACVCDNACVYDNARVYDNACVYGDACVCGDARVYGDACVCGDACVYDKDDIMWIAKIGSRNDVTTFFKNKDGGISVKCGCFKGDIDKFEEAVHKTHSGTKFEKEYLLAIELAKVKILGV